ncbi:UNVERIFIED_ORG: hypothetical protein ABIB21_003046 [Arthrobacter sp. UYEF13]
MSRNATQENANIFGLLIEFAADHGSAIPVGERRIFLDEDEYKIFVKSKRIKRFPIARRQAAVLLQVGDEQVIVVSGFESESFRSSQYIREIELSPGVAVAAIHDLGVRPMASALDVYNVVAAGSSVDDEYKGHALRDVKDLYPRIGVVEVDAEVAGEDHFHANLLILCAEEGTNGNGWINEGLADALIRLAEQRIDGFPYEFLVMASLEINPKSLFLALYRCLEATYAFKRSSELVERLGLMDKSWLDVAQALGDSLSWYPRHDQSLAAVLSMPAVDSVDLKELAESLGKDPDGDDVSARVAAGIRDLRNSLVHYGPTTRSVAVPDDDWNRLCIPLARVVGDVFAHTYGARLQ